MKKTIVLLTIFMIISIGCIGKDSLQTNEDSGLQTLTDTNGNSYDWCTPGNIASSSNGSGLTIKGMTEYQGTEVCEAEWKYEGGSITEYFTEDGATKMVYKDINGNIIDSNVSIEESNNETIPSTINITNATDVNIVNT